MKGQRIDYTVYSPNYVPGAGECWDHSTIRGAKFKAKKLGIGSKIIRNFNQENRAKTWIGNWWQSPYCLIWDGEEFVRIRSGSEDTWIVHPSSWERTPITRQFRSRRR
jgi:hypothetical protein